MAAHLWNPNGRLAEGANHHRKPGDPPVLIRSRVVGDDDFIVLCGRYGFVVWCFDKSVTLPTELRWNKKNPYTQITDQAVPTILYHPLSKFFTEPESESESEPQSEPESKHESGPGAGLESESE